MVIVEGEAERVDGETATKELIGRLDDAYEAKYGVGHGTPFFAVRPERVLAWCDYPTRWLFVG